MDQDTLTLAAVGDISLSYAYDDLLRSKGPHFPFLAVRPLLEGKDLVCCNLEGPLSLKGSSYPLKCGLRGHPEYVLGLAGAGFNYCSLGNNHILDYQEEALWDTVQLLERHGIGFSGVGANLEEATQPYRFQAKGIRVALFSFCDVEIDSPFYATSAQRGIAPFSMETAEGAFRSVRGEVDLIFVSVHWGKEHFPYPSPDQVRNARALVDQGAHLVMGHHPHVIQGVEKYRDALICYSLGNFLFSDILWEWTTESGEARRTSIRLDRRQRESMVIEARFSRHGLVSHAIHPVRLDRSLQVIPRADAAFSGRLERLSRVLQDPAYAKFFERARRRALRREKALLLLGKAARIHRIRPRHLKRLLGSMRAGGSPS